MAPPHLAITLFVTMQNLFAIATYPNVSQFPSSSSELPRSVSVRSEKARRREHQRAVPWEGCPSLGPGPPQLAGPRLRGLRGPRETGDGDLITNRVSGFRGKVHDVCGKWRRVGLFRRSQLQNTRLTTGSVPYFSTHSSADKVAFIKQSSSNNVCWTK